MFGFGLERKSGFRLAIVGLVLALGALSSVQAVEYNFTTVDAPGSPYTIVNGINNAGTVVGYYSDGTGGYAGFSRSAAGDFTSLTAANCPAPQDCALVANYAYGINNAGTIVGAQQYLFFPNGSFGYTGYRGFSMSEGGFSPLGTVWNYGINDAGTVVGPWTDLTYPGAAETHAAGINNAGTIVGWYTDAAGTHGFSWSEGAYTPLDYQGSGLTFTYAYGINNRDEIVGSFMDSSGQHGYVLSGGAYTVLDPADSSGTVAWGINDGGEISGYYSAASGGYHGFVAIPEPATLSLLILGAIALVRGRRRA